MGKIQQLEGMGERMNMSKERYRCGNGHVVFKEQKVE